MDLLAVGRDVDPDRGPHALPFKWRVLYEVVDIFDELRGPSQCVLERHLTSRLIEVFNFPAPKRVITPDDYLAAVDPAVRAQVRDGVKDLMWDHLVELVNRDGEADQEWCIRPLAPGYHFVHGWRKHWIHELEVLAAQPQGWRKWVRDFLAPQQAAVLLAAVIGAVVGAIATVVVSHL